MARSSCVKCGGGSFEMKVIEPRNAEYKQMTVQWTSCGGVAGVLGYYDSGVLLKEQQKEVAALKKGLQRIESQIEQIAYRLRS